MKRTLAAAVLTLAAAVPATAGDPIYYRQGDDGTLVLTNVPDRRDLRPMRSDAPPHQPGSGAQYRPLIERVARESGLQADLVYAVAAVESSFDPRARSEKGAIGLMQLMPETATRFGVSDPLDPVDNVRGGVRFLRYLLDLFDGNLRLALAAYNAGENVVRDLGRVPPYDETRLYVDKVLKRFGAGRRPYAASGSPASRDLETAQRGR